MAVEAEATEHLVAQAAREAVERRADVEVHRLRRQLGRRPEIAGEEDRAKLQDQPAEDVLRGQVRVAALRNGTIGWTLAEQKLEHGADRHGEIGLFEGAQANAREVAYRAGVRHVSMEEASVLQAQSDRTLYRFDVRDAEEYAAGHLKEFRHYAGGQLVQEVDMAAPVRGARIVLTDDRNIRAEMTASWLAQMGWEVYVLDGGYDGALEKGAPVVVPKQVPG